MIEYSHIIAIVYAASLASCRAHFQKARFLPSSARREDLRTSNSENCLALRASSSKGKAAASWTVAGLCRWNEIKNRVET